MYRRTIFYSDTPGPRVPIDHKSVCDGIAQFAFSRFYPDRDATCGVCARDFILNALAQKEIVERNACLSRFSIEVERSARLAYPSGVGSST